MFIVESHGFLPQWHSGHFLLASVHLKFGFATKANIGPIQLFKLDDDAMGGNAQFKVEKRANPIGMIPVVQRVQSGAGSLKLKREIGS